MGKVLELCGGFALALLGCIISFHGSTNIGLVLASGGILVLLNSLPSTTRED